MKGEERKRRARRKTPICFIVTIRESLKVSWFCAALFFVSEINEQDKKNAWVSIQRPSQLWFSGQISQFWVYIVLGNNVVENA